MMTDGTKRRAPLAQHASQRALLARFVPIDDHLLSLVTLHDDGLNAAQVDALKQSANTAVEQIRLAQVGKVGGAKLETTAETVAAEQ